MSLKVSFIIPVYNASKFLRKSVGSILDQDYDNIELILVNDGCKDGSAIICDILALYPIVRVIHQDNRGASTARNVGLSLAQGDYVWFVDADDCLIPNCLSKIVHCIEEYNTIDVANLDYVTSMQPEKTLKSYTGINLMKGCEYLDNTDGRLYIWNRIYRTNFLKDNGLLFLDGTKNIEDFLFNIQVFLLADKIVNTGILGYIYNNENENSTSRSREKSNLLKLSEDSIAIHLKIKELQSCLPFVKQKIINKILSKSCAGFFYSLLVYKYDIEYIKKVFHIYKTNGLYPIKSIHELKANAFIHIVNMKYLYLVVCWLHKKLC